MDATRDKGSFHGRGAKADFFRAASMRSSIYHNKNLEGIRSRNSTDQHFYALVLKNSFTRRFAILEYKPIFARLWSSTGQEKTIVPKGANPYRTMEG